MVQSLSPSTRFVSAFLISMHMFLQCDAFSFSSPIRTTVTSAISNDASSLSLKVTSTLLLNAFHNNDFYYPNSHNDDDDDDDDEFLNFQAYTPIDVDSARQQLESLVGAGSGSLSHEQEIMSSSSPLRQQTQQRTTLTNIRIEKDEKSFSKTSISAGASIASSPYMSDVTEPPPLNVELPQRSPMTSIERERRLAEIDILRNMLHHEDAIADLWSLWFSERGPQAEAVLKEADELMGGHVRQQLEAERLLRSLIEEHGVYFVEPINRLATLYFTQERMEESLALNKIVLAVKPWHVGALSHIVMVYEAMGNSMMARSWARFRFPTASYMGSNKRRERWVERAIHDARRMFELGEEINVMSFGEADQHLSGRQPTTHSNYFGDDAWQ
ncbi:hypothetical protein IV203_002890 [Nitzschia inconspicua]|uniref:Uncharacterized protein n=1 Tax=Nitzschia inconspicua TaxID=303405 RepID=A0A9K3L2G7_9STRA|nr:hypothetical protein IV203_002890 [Nitzschia inconspicua]